MKPRLGFPSFWWKWNSSRNAWSFVEMELLWLSFSLGVNRLIHYARVQSWKRSFSMKIRCCHLMNRIGLKLQGRASCCCWILVLCFGFAQIKANSHSLQRTLSNHIQILCLCLQLQPLKLLWNAKGESSNFPCLLRAGMNLLLNSMAFENFRSMVR